MQHHDEMTIEQVALELDCSTVTVYKYKRDKILRGRVVIEHGRRRGYYKRADVMKLKAKLESRK